jgi:hypothetical protein
MPNEEFREELAKAAEDLYELFSAAASASKAKL